MVIIVASIHLECASVTKNRTCKVNMDSLLGTGRPGPRVKINRRLFVSNTLTSHTVMNYRLNFFVNPWPPNMKTSQQFHSIIGCPACSSSRTSFLCFKGTKTQTLHKTHPSSTVNCSCLLKYTLNSVSASAFPCLHYDENVLCIDKQIIAVFNAEGMLQLMLEWVKLGSALSPAAYDQSLR